MTSLKRDICLPCSCFAASNSCEGFKNYYGEAINRQANA